MQDEDEYCYLDRTTKPLLFDRATNQITLTETDTTEYLVFISYPSTRKSDYKKVLGLSETAPFLVTDLHQKEYKICFYPVQVSEGTEEFDYISMLFPKLREQKNFDSEVHAIYSLLRNAELITTFIQNIPDALGFVRLGLRYYSFLDTCGRCQEFLVDNQVLLKERFMEAARMRFPAHVDIPFLSFAHGNRIYRNNHYQSLNRRQACVNTVCE